MPEGDATLSCLSQREEDGLYMLNWSRTGQLGHVRAHYMFTLVLCDFPSTVLNTHPSLAISSCNLSTNQDMLSQVSHDFVSHLIISVNWLLG